MDNVTHSLIGIAAAEALATTRHPSARVKFWVASAVANNLPDLDVLYARFGDRLFSMLQHRGYTHTLLLSPVQSLLWLLVLRWWWRRNDVPWRSVAALCFLGPFLHIFADAWNSYGVHPFWPLDNRWYYGDLVFILEPWIWVAILPIIWWRCNTRFGQGISLLLLAGILSAAWYHPYVSFGAASVITLVTAGWMVAQRYLRDDRLRIAGSFVGLVLFFGVFAWAQLGLKRAFAGEGTEIAAQPAPGNPFCWTILSAGFKGTEYRAAAWTAAAWPSIVPASSCRSQLRSGTELKPFGEATAARIPLGEFRGTRAQYDQIIKSCRARSYLRFARIPYWETNGTKHHLGDLRFGATYGFGEQTNSGEPEVCLSFEPPWVGRFHPSALPPSSPML
jgi:inner membrane protein